MEIQVVLPKGVEDNPNIKSIKIEMREPSSRMIPNKLSFNDEEFACTLVMFVEVEFNTPVVLLKDNYNRVEFTYDIAKDKCSPTFYGDGVEPLPFFMQFRLPFERFMRVMSRPVGMLSSEELKERKRYEEFSPFGVL